MAAVKESKWIVSVNGNPSYCGIGAGGVQFANGKAEITSKRMQTGSWSMMVIQLQHSKVVVI